MDSLLGWIEDGQWTTGRAVPPEGAIWASVEQSGASSFWWWTCPVLCSRVSEERYSESEKQEAQAPVDIPPRVPNGTLTVPARCGGRGVGSAFQQLYCSKPTFRFPLSPVPVKACSMFMFIERVYLLWLIIIYLGGECTVVLCFVHTLTLVSIYWFHIIPLIGPCSSCRIFSGHSLLNCCWHTLTCTPLSALFLVPSMFASVLSRSYKALDRVPMLAQSLSHHHQGRVTHALSVGSFLTALFCCLFVYIFSTCHVSRPRTRI